jgi:hypothetical protein
MIVKSLTLLQNYVIEIWGVINSNLLTFLSLLIAPFMYKIMWLYQASVAWLSDRISSSYQHVLLAIQIQDTI